MKRTITILITALVVPVLVVAGLEIVLAFAGSGQPLTVVRPCRIAGSAAYCDNQAFTSVVFPLGVTRPSTPYAFLATKPAGTYRIFVLGESAAFGDPDPAYSFSRYLDVLLRDRFPQQRFEVINASITAINSHALLRMAKELSAYQPDLFIVYAGNNEIIGPYGPGTTLTAQVPSLPVIRANMAFRSTRVGQLLLKLTQKPREFRGMEMFLDQQVTADSPELPTAYAYLASNLDGIVSAAQKVGADVVLSTVGTNLRDSFPFRSAHKANLSEQERREWQKDFAAGEAKQANGDCEGALQEYSNAERLDQEFADLQFRMATCLEKTGDAKDATLRFDHAKELDTLRFRADRGINDAIRTLAQKRQPGATLVDTAAILSKAASDGIPGHELFYDHVHLRPRANYLVAAALFQQLKPMVQRKTGAFEKLGPLLLEAECEKQLALTEFDVTRIAQQMQRRLAHPPFTQQANNAEQLADYKLEEREHTADLEASLANYEWAIQRNPNDYLLRQNLGLLLYGINRQAAVAQLRLSRPYHDIPLFMPDGTRIE